MTIQLDYSMLYQILIEAEMRRDNDAWPEEVRRRSAATVQMVEEKMEREGITREELKAACRA